MQDKKVHKIEIKNIGFRQRVRDLEDLLKKADGENADLRRLNSNAHYTLLLLAATIEDLAPHVATNGEHEAVVVDGKGEAHDPVAALLNPLREWAQAFLACQGLSAKDQADLVKQVSILSVAAKANQAERELTKKGELGRSLAEAVQAEGA